MKTLLGHIYILTLPVCDRSYKIQKCLCSGVKPSDIYNKLLKLPAAAMLCASHLSFILVVFGASSISVGDSALFISFSHF